MGCSTFRSDESGYATPAALVLALALSLVASAMVARSLSGLSLSRRDLSVLRTEYALNGVQLEAAAAVVRTQQPWPYEWTIPTEAGIATIRADPEKDKLSLAAAAILDDNFFRTFGVGSPAKVKQALSLAADNHAFIDVGGLDDAALWRECAPSLISSSGERDSLAYAPPSEPVSGPGPEPQSWRIGEVWRIRVSTNTGWRDERFVRFTGDARHPAAVVTRRLSRGSGVGAQCEALLRAVSGA